MESRSGPAESAPCDGAAHVLAHEGSVGCGEDTGAPDHFADRRVAAHIHLALAKHLRLLSCSRREDMERLHSVSVGGRGRGLERCHDGWRTSAARMTTSCVLPKGPPCITSGRLAASLTSLYCSMSWPHTASSKQPTTGYACIATKRRRCEQAQRREP